MKNITIVMVLALMVIAGTTHGQSSLNPMCLSVAYHKTTNLVFPYNIKSVDRGSLDVLVQKAKNVENVLQVKAGKESFAETNLTVITADGNLYSFLVGYSENPDLNVVLTSVLPEQRTGIAFSDLNDNESAVQDIARKVARKKHFMRDRDERFNISINLGGIYVEDNIMYFQLELTNNSHIGYDIEQLRFFIRDKKKTKRTASQEMELTPLFIEGNTVSIDGSSSHTIVVAMEKFTIPDRKYLAIQMMEAEGGRHLELRDGNKTLIRSRLLH